MSATLLSNVYRRFFNIFLRFLRFLTFSYFYLNVYYFYDLHIDVLHGLKKLDHSNPRLSRSWIQGVGRIGRGEKGGEEGDKGT